MAAAAVRGGEAGRSFSVKSFPSFRGRIERGEETMNKSRNREIQRETTRTMREAAGMVAVATSGVRSPVLRVFASHCSRELRQRSDAQKIAHFSGSDECDYSECEL